MHISIQHFPATIHSKCMPTNVLVINLYRGVSAGWGHIQLVQHSAGMFLIAQLACPLPKPILSYNHIGLKLAQTVPEWLGVISH